MNATKREPGLMIPDGMTPVSRDTFFALLRADPRDIMPSLMKPNYTTWETRGREVWGWTAPGWRNSGECPEVYAIATAALAKDERP